MKIKVSVAQQGNVFCATIAGGWWSATASTRESAIENVVQRYEKENQYHRIETKEPVRITLDGLLG